MVRRHVPTIVVRDFLGLVSLRAECLSPKKVNFLNYNRFI